MIFFQKNHLLRHASYSVTSITIIPSNTPTSDILNISKQRNRLRGSGAHSVQKWVIDSDVENQLRSGVLWERLSDASLSHGSVEIYLRCLNLTAIGWGNDLPFDMCPSLLRVDLSGCPKLESIPELTFAECSQLVSVVFGEHSNITNLGGWVFQDCVALTSITLPDKLEVNRTGGVKHLHLPRARRL